MVDESFGDSVHVALGLGLASSARTEKLEGVVRGVVTSNLVVTTQGGVVTTPPSKRRGCNNPPF